MAGRRPRTSTRPVGFTSTTSAATSSTASDSHPAVTSRYGGGLAPVGSLAVDPTLRANGADATQFYTKTFGGTSSASPIVAGAAALIQSTRNEFGLPLLNSFDMRSLLASTGTPQLAG